MHRREGGVWPKRGAQIIRIKGPGAAANRRQSRYNVATPGSQRFEGVRFGELPVHRRVASFEAGDSRSFWQGDPTLSTDRLCGKPRTAGVVVAQASIEPMAPGQDASRDRGALALLQSLTLVR